jgi:hypothetical protein
MARLALLSVSRFLFYNIGAQRSNLYKNKNAFHYYQVYLTMAGFGLRVASNGLWAESCKYKKYIFNLQQFALTIEAARLQASFFFNCPSALAKGN